MFLAWWWRIASIKNWSFLLILTSHDENWNKTDFSPRRYARFCQMSTVSRSLSCPQWLLVTAKIHEECMRFEHIQREINPSVYSLCITACWSMSCPLQWQIHCIASTGLFQDIWTLEAPAQIISSQWFHKGRPLRDSLNAAPQPKEAPAHPFCNLCHLPAGLQLR